MSWRFDLFQSYKNSGSIVNAQTVTDIVGDFTLEKTIGDQFFIKSGDLSLTLKAPLPIPVSVSTSNWLAAYYNNRLVDVFYYGDTDDPDNQYDFLEYDEKNGVYKTRLKSLQWYLFTAFQNTLVEYSATSTDWAYNLSTAIITVERLRAYQGDGVYIDTLNAGAFSLNTIPQIIAGKTNGHGVIIGSVQIGDLPIIGDDDLPVVYRGGAGGGTNQQIIESTFDDYPTAWIEIFRYLSFIYNAFVVFTPVITGGNLYARIDVVPKINLTAGSATTPVYRSRTYKRRKYRIDGVRLKGHNFEYTQGNVESDNVFEREVNLSDPEQADDLADERLYISVGTFVSGFTYSIVDGSANPLPYLAGGLVEPYYSGMITAGDGVEAEINLGAEDVLSQINAGSDVAQINRITARRTGPAKIEGIVL